MVHEARSRFFVKKSSEKRNEVIPLSNQRCSFDPPFLREEFGGEALSPLNEMIRQKRESVFHLPLFNNSPPVPLSLRERG
jgi:hypothetical protein